MAYLSSNEKICNAYKQKHSILKQIQNWVKFNQKMGSNSTKIVMNCKVKHNQFKFEKYHSWGGGGIF